MSSIFQRERPHGLLTTAIVDPTQAEEKPWQDPLGVKAALQGAFHEGSTRAAFAGTVLVGGAVRLFNEEAGDWIFDRAMYQREFWAERKPQIQGTWQQIMYGLGGFGGKVASGGGIFGGTVIEALGTTFEEQAVGTDTKTAMALGLTKGAVFYGSAAMPFAWAPAKVVQQGGMTLTATRLSYGVASNAGLGIIDRAAEQAILESGGYTERAAKIKVFDPEAIAIDSTIGLALGGVARFADARRAKIEAKTEAETRAKIAELDQGGQRVKARTAELIKASESRPFDAAGMKQAEATRATLDQPNTVRLQEIETKLQDEGVKGYKAEAKKAEAAEREAQAAEIDMQIEAYKQAVKADETLQNIDSEFAADKSALDWLEVRRAETAIEAAESITPEQLDAAMVGNLQKKMEDQAAGIPKSTAAIEKHHAAAKEVETALEEGRPADVAIIKQAIDETIDDPRMTENLHKQMKATIFGSEEGFDAYNRASLMNDPVDRIDMPAYADDAVEQADIAVIESLKDMPDDMVLEFEDGKMTMAEFKKQAAEEAAKIADDDATMDAMVACMLGGANG